MAKYLVIVESPAKVKTIKKFLGANYEVMASQGHVRDLPKSQLGFDPEHDYEPKYITIRGKGDLLASLRKEVKKADKIYLATDPDREGEAISWHLYYALKLESKKVYRITFNEITKNAVKESLKNAREIDMNLVDAQQARRMLDRMVGYRISPLLWAKIKRGLSAGRVQSVALRIICDREDEINAFIPEEYWSLDVNLKVKEGEKLVIIGPSGSGKSTIAKLMAGFWDATKGKVVFGGKNIKEIPFAQLMGEVSYVAQDNFLFDESIRENIRLGKPDATDDEVVAAAKAACCHEFIVKLENGYDTNAGDAGGKLSGGERQRITIARAILKNARVIILDEATAYADPENEYLIQNAISKLVKGKTLIVVAHRLATIQKADQILVVENGKIVGCGRQEELLSECPLYQRLWSDYVSSADQVEGGTF